MYHCIRSSHGSTAAPSSKKLQESAIFAKGQQLYCTSCGTNHFICTRGMPFQMKRWIRGGSDIWAESCFMGVFFGPCSFFGGQWAKTVYSRPISPSPFNRMGIVRCATRTQIIENCTGIESVESSGPDYYSVCLQC